MNKLAKAFLLAVVIAAPVAISVPAVQATTVRHTHSKMGHTARTHSRKYTSTHPHHVKHAARPIPVTGS